MFGLLKKQKASYRLVGPIDELNELRIELDALYSQYEEATDRDLIDSISLKIKAIKLKQNYIIKSYKK